MLEAVPLLSNASLFRWAHAGSSGMGIAMTISAPGARWAAMGESDGLY